VRRGSTSRLLWGWVRTRGSRCLAKLGACRRPGGRRWTPGRCGACTSRPSSSPPTPAIHRRSGIESFVDQIPSAAKASNGNSRPPAARHLRRAPIDCQISRVTAACAPEANDSCPRGVSGREAHRPTGSPRPRLGRRSIPRSVRVRRLNCCRRRVPNRVPSSANLTQSKRTPPNEKTPKQTQQPCKSSPSKPAGPGSPRVGRFDSFAAPLNGIGTGAGTPACSGTPTPGSSWST